MAYYDKVNTDIKLKLYVELILKNHPDFAEGTPFREALVQKPQVFNIEHLIEDMMAINSGGQYNFIDGIHEDFDDGSECKTGTLHLNGISSAEITNVKSQNGVLKKGAVRCVVLNPRLKKLHFVFIPKKALLDLMTTKNGTIKKSKSAWLKYTDKKDSFDRCFQKYGITEFDTFKELAMEKNR